VIHRHWLKSLQLSPDLRTARHQVFAASPGAVEGSRLFGRRVANCNMCLDNWPHSRRLAQGVILPFCKAKVSRHDCSNYRGITLLSVPGKVFAHVLLSRVRERLRSYRRVRAQWLCSTQINYRSHHHCPASSPNPA